MTNSFIIRKAQSSDTDVLVELAATTFRDAYRSLDDPADIDDYVKTHFTSANFASILRNRESTLLLAHLRNVSAGYVHIRHSVAPACVTGASPMELSRLYLRQELTGRGFGTALFRVVIAEAQRTGRETIWLSVYDRNLRTIEFHRRWGFVNVGTKEFLFGGKRYDDPVMAAPIPL